MSMEGVANVCVGADEAWKHNRADAFDIQCVVHIIQIPESNKNI